MRKALASTSAQTPSYTTENDFVGKNGTAKNAAAFLSLDAASAIDIAVGGPAKPSMRLIASQASRIEFSPFSAK